MFDPRFFNYATTYTVYNFLLDLPCYLTIGVVYHVTHVPDRSFSDRRSRLLGLTPGGAGQPSVFHAPRPSRNSKRPRSAKTSRPRTEDKDDLRASASPRHATIVLDSPATSVDSDRDRRSGSAAARVQRKKASGRRAGGGGDRGADVSRRTRTGDGGGSGGGGDTPTGRSPGSRGVASPSSTRRIIPFDTATLFN